MSTQVLAQGLSSLGRNGDSTLVHMQPREVEGLQALARAHGGSLTINPHTGLAEAGFLGDILGAVAPIAVGAFLGGPLGLSALQAGLVTGAAGFALSGGDLGAALSAGLGGAGGVGLGNSLSQFATPEIAKISAVNPVGAQVAAQQAATNAASGFNVGMANANMGISQAGYNLANNIPNVASTATDLTKQGFMGDIRNTFGTKPEYSMGSVGEGAKNALKDPMGFFGKTGPGTIQNAITLASPLLAIKPEPYKVPEDTSYQMKYEGPYTPQDRKPRMPTMEEQAALRAAGSPEYSYFGDTNPYPGFNKAAGYAYGGAIDSPASSAASGGLTDLYATKDGTGAQNAPSEGFGLARLNSLAENNVTSYADGGAIAFDAGGTVPYMGGAPSYGIAPTDLSQVAAIPTTGGSDSGTNFIQGMSGNALTDPMGRTSSGMGGKGMGDGSPTGNMTYLNGIRPNGGKGGSESVMPKALSMQDYINSAARVYNPAASMATATNPGAVEQAQFTNINPQQPVAKAMGGGIHALKSGGNPTQGGYLDGAGDGMSDSIPATIGGKQPARLADGEFVIPADVVSHFGNGSTKAGAQHLYKVMDKVRKARTGRKSQGKQINPNRFMSA